MARTIKPGQTERYRVETEWKGEVNQATYAYEMILQAARYLEKKPEFVEATFRMQDLRMTRNGEAMPRVRLGGVFGIKFQPTGGPIDLVAGGAAATLGVPLLGWYLPDAVAPDGTFAVTNLQVDKGIFADGTGRLVSLSGGAARFTYDFLIGPSNSSPDIRVVRFRAETTIRLDTGQVQSTQGTLTDPTGTTTFKITRR